MNQDVIPQSDNSSAPLDSSFEITLEMLSDWHVGSGTGRPGHIDRMVRRDAEGFPYVPAKTLTGIWRDACERVAHGLDKESEEKLWSQWVAWLFGDQPAIKDKERARNAASKDDRAEQEMSSNAADKESDRADENAGIEEWKEPRSAALSVRSAHLPADLRQALGHEDKAVARAAVTFVKPGVSIHPRTGRARTDFLRFEEMARGGVTLSAVAELREGLEENQRRAASALLIAGTKLVERLGGKRRRGAGRCALTIRGKEAIEPWLDWINEHPQPPLPPPQSLEDQTDSVMPVADGDWLRVRLTLHTKLPVVVPAGLIGNLIKTLDYIPGTYLLPQISKRLKGPRESIARGDLVVTNATLAIENHQGRPVPFSLFYRKSGGGLKDGAEVFNRLCESGPNSQPKNHRAGYVGSTTRVKPAAQGGRLPVYEMLDPQVETHNVVDDTVQRPTEAVGGVYSYQAIPPGVTLRAELRLRQSLNDELTRQDPVWFKRLAGQLRLGRASKDDYGLVELVVAGEPELLPRTLSVSNELTVWLLSDVLLRDERLRPTASLERLGEVLQISLNDRLDESQQIELKLRPEINGRWSALPRQRRTDSWHVGWGLPRPSLAGLQAGTCAVFTVTGQPDQMRLAEILAEIEASGIGERCAEGYGQLCFNDPLVTTTLEGLRGDRLEKNIGTEKPFLVPRQSSFAYAQVIEREAARNEMRRAVAGFAADREKRKAALGIEIINGRSLPRMSQLGALRSALSRVRATTEKHHLQTWLDQLKKTPNRHQDWPDGSLKRVDDLITDEQRVWELLELDFTQLILTENGAETLPDELWAEAVRTLVDACVQAHKRDCEGERRDG